MELDELKGEIVKQKVSATILWSLLLTIAVHFS